MPATDDPRDRSLAAIPYFSCFSRVTEGPTFLILGLLLLLTGSSSFFNLLEEKARPLGPPGVCVDINRDVCSRIRVLPGIGPVRAEAIVEYRTRHGPFRCPEDLTRVPGIGPGLVEIMLPFLDPAFLDPAFPGRDQPVEEKREIEDPVGIIRRPGRSES